MFKRLLIANRGEIACRVIATCRRLGIGSVAVYSDADEGALHVRLADLAVRIGGAAARESYLDGRAIIEAARRTEAEAIHPGYGFLSENADFAEACADAGIAFVGPPAAAIRAMGSKSAAKALMAEAGVPILEGYHGEADDAATLAAAAGRIGYPLLIKPSGGGGGRGMRVVVAADDLAAAIESARREALSSFGDDRVLLERYLARPRHVEVQVFADASGNAIHLHERDCSVQRRHQKVIEEAPAPGLAEATRRAIGEAAVAAARAVGYVGAGTVEFLLDEAGGFHFLEMNTRLQVEHPVTEMITGYDLVEWQLLIAAGEPLPAGQDAVGIRGHAIEARLYAEDPARGFLPSTGPIAHLRLPRTDATLRIDVGVREGDRITAHYDPLIAKVIAHGADRAAARARLAEALAEVEVAGPVTNRDFLAAVLAHAEFAAGGADTGLVERALERLAAEPATVPDEVLVFAALAVREARAAAAAARAARAGDAHSPWAAARGWRLNAPGAEAVSLRRGEAVIDVVIEGDRFVLPDGPRTVRAARADGGALSAEIDGARLRAGIARAAAETYVFTAERTWRLADYDPVAEAEAHAAGAAAAGAVAPMPGVVVAVAVEPGATVLKGAPLVVIEAMKVEHTIRAPADGTVAAVHCAVGDNVEEGAELVAFMPAEAGAAPAGPEA